MNEKYLRFQNAVRPDVKLRISLDEYVRMDKEEENSPESEEYGGYLSERRRAAWELLIREENLDGLRLFAKKKWLTGKDARECLETAVRLKKRESQLWLLQYMREPQKALENFPEDSGTDGKNRQNADEAADGNISRNISEDPPTDICKEILQVLESMLESRIPALASAVPYISFAESGKNNMAEVTWGTDGKFLYYEPRELIALFRKGMDYLARAFLHSLFHCLYLHVICPELSRETGCGVNRGGLEVESGGRKRRWNLACDLAVEWAVDESGWFPLEIKRQKRRTGLYQAIMSEENGRDTKSCYRWLAGQEAKGGTDILMEIEEEFVVDQHSCWYEIRGKCGKSLGNNEYLAQTWGNARQGLSLQLQGKGQRAGIQGGAGIQEYRSGKKKIYDYRRFLKQFSICREEMQLDMESFDYIPYYYGMERYGNILLVEPLETMEVNRLEEFVIAIDTSGSCSGETVCRFLDETYNILSGRENFFRKMNVHIIQCDSVIQDHRKITCQEDWKAYQENVRIQGLGGTDFTPVFRLVDEMLERKEIRNLKGLLYFTDGDGIFPRSKPTYETAFVFLNRALEKSKIPDWAIRLNLEM